MDFNLSEDQQILDDTVRDLFERECSISVVRGAEPGGFSKELWRRILEMGLPSIGVSAEFGGGDAGMSELAIVAENVGRYLAPVPFVEAAVANLILNHLATNNHLEPTIRRVTSGNALATVALRPVRGTTARAVPAGAVADVVIALNGTALVVDESPGSGITLPNLGAMAIAHRTVSGEAPIIAEGDDAVSLHVHAVRLWQLLTAVALVGLGRKALDIAIEYVQQRRAFGVRIASFQTIQHTLADDVSRLEGARLLAYEAAWMHDRHEDRADQCALMAFLYASEAALKAATNALHFHGGYGFSLEYDIQLFLRRAKAWPLVCGDPTMLYAELGRGFSSAMEE